MTRNRTELNVEGLESRIAPARHAWTDSLGLSVVYDNQTHVATVTGTTGDDVVTLDQGSKGRLVVHHRLSGQAAASERIIDTTINLRRHATHVIVNAGAGNDTVECKLSAASAPLTYVTINGEAGRDTFFALGVNGELNGGDGDDHFFAGIMPNAPPSNLYSYKVDGGNGKDTIWYGAGPPISALNGGAGLDVFVYWPPFKTQFDATPKDYDSTEDYIVSSDLTVIIRPH
jgi:Ca2+-binding RTX toxin-like protein